MYCFKEYWLTKITILRQCYECKTHKRMKQYMESLALVNGNYLTLTLESGLWPCRRKHLLLAHPHPTEAAGRLAISPTRGAEFHED